MDSSAKKSRVLNLGADQLDEELNDSSDDEGIDFEFVQHGGSDKAKLMGAITVLK